MKEFNVGDIIVNEDDKLDRGKVMDKFKTQYVIYWYDNREAKTHNIDDLFSCYILETDTLKECGMLKAENIMLKDIVDKLSTLLNESE